MVVAEVPDLKLLKLVSGRLDSHGELTFFVYRFKNGWVVLGIILFLFLFFLPYFVHLILVIILLPMRHDFAILPAKIFLNYQSNPNIGNTIRVLNTWVNKISH